MEWGFLLGLSVITLVVIGLVIFLGLKLNKAVEKHAPEMTFPVNVTKSGIVLFASVVACWVCLAALRLLRPDSSLGAFLNTADGVAAVLLGSVFFAAVAAAILEKLGYPIARRDDQT